MKRRKIFSENQAKGIRARGKSGYLHASYFKKLIADHLIEDEHSEIIWLPTAAPNLNLIERLWKFMKKKVLKNNFYGTAKYFREKVEEFFPKIKDYKTELETLLTYNFGVLKFSQSIL